MYAILLPTCTDLMTISNMISALNPEPSTYDTIDPFWQKLHYAACIHIYCLKSKFKYYPSPCTVIKQKIYFKN